MEKGRPLEFYYSDAELTKEKNGKRLYFTNEVDHLHNKSINKLEIRKLDVMRNEDEFSKKVFDEPKMCESVNWIHSKSRFADLVEIDNEFIEGFDFNNFHLIFNKIKSIYLRLIPFNALHNFLRP